MWFECGEIQEKQLLQVQLDLEVPHCYQDPSLVLSHLSGLFFSDKLLHMASDSPSHSRLRSVDQGARALQHLFQPLKRILIGPTWVMLLLVH